MKRFDNIIPIDSNAPQPEQIQTAAEAIIRGELVVFPTTCLYGLAADALNPAAVQTIFRAKQRPENNPLLILVKNQNTVATLVKSVPSAAEILMKVFWPGRLTIVFPAREDLPPALTAGTGKIGIRIPVHPVAAALVDMLDTPIIGTSANLSSQEGCYQISALHPHVARHAGLILDAGTLLGGVGSTVVDVTVNPPVVLREGIIPAEKIHHALHKNSK